MVNEPRNIAAYISERSPYLIIPVLALIAIPLTGSFATWTTLTLAGAAMGMMIFLMASGMGLVFGLMDVLNFGHGVFVTLGAYIASSLIIPLAGPLASDSLMVTIGAFLLVVLGSTVAGAALGYAFEKIIIAPVYGDHLRQILITMGALIVAEQLVPVIWSDSPVQVARPTAFQGAFIVGDVAFEKYRLAAVVIGVLVYVVMQIVLSRSKVGLLVRAGVENREMVEALGYRVNLLFIGVFVAGSALAGLGGAMWAFYSELITASIGNDVMIMVFIVVIIGGLGSVRGALIGALLVGLTTNYVGFIAPKMALGSNILLMVIILMWRPNGLLPMGRR